jgi:hypothetical protein
MNASLVRSIQENLVSGCGKFVIETLDTETGNKNEPFLE